jgi:TM2 domain-containing membrane protein YozV
MELEQKKTHTISLGYILWLFGFTGAHRFYYGKTFTGILYFFTLGLLGVGWLIDFFLIPEMERDAELKYTHGKYNYNITWILVTFFGVFGIHRFYLRKWITGTIWLLTGGFFLLGYLYDFLNLNEIVSERNILD